MTSTTKNTVPSSSSTFLADLDTFLREEDADRFRDMFVGFIKSGGTHVTGAGLVHTPDSLVAYPGGHYITETGSITYPDTTTHLWVICHKDTTTAVTDWTRESGTHYLFRNTGSGTKPALPVPESAILIKVTTAAGAVSVVEDHRDLEAMARITGVSPDGELITDGTFHVVSGGAGVVTAWVNADEFVVESAGAGGLSILTPATAIGTIAFGSTVSNTRSVIQYDHTNDLFIITSNNNEVLRAGAGEYVFNESGVDRDFRVESNLNPNMLFVDAGNNSVHIDNNLLTGAGDGDLVMANNNFIRFINQAGTTSANYGIRSSTANNLELHVPASNDQLQFVFNNTSPGQVVNENSGLGLLFSAESSSDHTAPSANGCVLYTRDTGAKTELVARFNSGAIQQVAIEP